MFLLLGLLGCEQARKCLFAHQGANEMFRFECMGLGDLGALAVEALGPGFLCLMG